MPITSLMADDTAKPRVFDYADQLVADSGVVEMLEERVAAARRGTGRPPSGIRYTIRAVLVAAVMLVYRQRAVTYTSIIETILDLTDGQLDAVGMTLSPEQKASVHWGVVDARREYGRFHGWWDRILATCDPYWDLPRRRQTVAETRAALGRRTPEQQADAAERHEVLTDLANALIVASIDTVDPMQGATYGIDETTLMCANPDREIGSKPTKKRAALPAANYFTRDKGVVVDAGDGGTSRGGGKRGAGVGVTTMSRFGPRHDLLAAPPVFVAVAFGPVTSGDPGKALSCVDRAVSAGLARPAHRNRRAPLVAVDRGYSIKIGFNDGLLSRGFAGAFHYREGWSGVSMSPSVSHPVLGRTDTGPVHAWGGHYCPAVAHLLREDPVIRTDDLKTSADWDRHDARLRRLLPARMGVNGRPSLRHVRAGRPVVGIDSPQEWRQTLICPAVQGRVQCPLKPASMKSIEDGPLQPDGRPWGPELRPSWEADRYLCCQKSQVTVPMTADQVRNHQPGMQAGSWEHIFFLEAARSLTEQRYADLKSAHIGNLQSLQQGPRSTPMAYLVTAIALAVTNRRSQDSHDAWKRAAADRWPSLERRLGRPPMQSPPLT